MPDSPTEPLRSRTQSIRIPAAEVVEGPDQGTHCRARTERLQIGTAEGNEMVLRDGTVSRFHLELVAGRSGGISVTDLQSTNGTLLGGVRLERAVVPVGTVLRLGRTSIRVVDGGTSTAELLETDRLDDLLGRAPAMRRVMAQLRQVAASDVPVLIGGESGTGKELAARALHRLGSRASGPFVTVDCGALSPTLVASDLFGHVRGAFTGATRNRPGAFELANGGTLLLDEIGELPPELQPILLGVLERRKFRRVGDDRELPVDVRIVCATHRDLRREVNARGFRLDLYHRIATVTVELPPLRDRPEDIPPLVAHLLGQCGHGGSVSEHFSEEALERLQQHRWPGNVRELRNFIEAALALGSPPLLEEDESTEGSEAGAGGEDVIAKILRLEFKHARSTVLTEFERRYLAALLERNGQNVSRAAREAKMDRTWLIDLIGRHGLRGGSSQGP